MSSGICVLLLVLSDLVQKYQIPSLMFLFVCLTRVLRVLFGRPGGRNYNPPVLWKDLTLCTARWTKPLTGDEGYIVFLNTPFLTPG